MNPDVLVMGETLIDFLPDASGPLAETETFSRRAGGAPANVAVGLARLGAPPWFRTRVGADPFGEFLAATLAAEGVPSRFVERDPDAKTTLAFVSRGDDPAFTFYRDRTADTRMKPGVVPDSVLESVEWVHVGGVTLASEPARTATLDLAERARDRGCTVSFDPNARPELWPSGFPDAVAEAFALADVVKTTPGDLRAAGFRGTPAELAATVNDAGPHTVLLTRGEAGAHASATDAAPWGAASVEHLGYDVDAVDETGAGDAFTAGAIAALVDGRRLDGAVAFANAVAALSTTARGGMAGLPEREVVDAFRG